MTFTYGQRTAEPWPDLSHYHFVGDPAAYGAAHPVAIEFKVREEGTVDPTWRQHDADGEWLNIPRLGYEFAHDATSADFLSIFPPEPGRIAVLDAERSDLTLAEAEAWVVGVRKSYGVDRTWLYSRNWLKDKNISGTVLADCPSQQAQYNSSLTPVACPPLRVVVWQYAGGGDWPVPPGAPRTFPGVSPVGEHCDMNVLLIPVGEFRTMAGLDGGDDLALDRDKDKATLALMLNDLIGFKPTDAGFWLRAMAGIGDVARGYAKRNLDEPYGLAYDWAKAMEGGGKPHAHAYSGTTLPA